MDKRRATVRVAPLSPHWWSKVPDHAEPGTGRVYVDLDSETASDAAAMAARQEADQHGETYPRRVNVEVDPLGQPQPSEFFEVKLGDAHASAYPVENSADSPSFPGRGRSR